MHQSIYHSSIKMYPGWVLLNMHDTFPVTLCSFTCYVTACLVACYLIIEAVQNSMWYNRKFRLETLALRIEWHYMVSEKWTKRALNENENEQIYCLFIEKGIGALSWLGSMSSVTEDLPVQWCFSSLKQADSMSCSVPQTVSSYRHSGNGICAMEGIRRLNGPTFFW